MLRIRFTRFLKQALPLSGLAAAMLMLGAGQSSAASQGVNYIFVYYTPRINVIAGVQASANNILVTNQNSHTNVLDVLQLGASSTAISQQNGFNNFGAVIQVAPTGLGMALGQP
ncbi:MAG TPA: hypothetical protein VEH76_05430 [Methylocystis sp.]|nr:hypothetical protein [Methylocystis sp.]